MQKPKTLFEKVWDSHVVRAPEGEPTLLYIDLHLVHEVTSPQAFEGLRLANRKVRRPDLTFATIDHNVPTTSDERFQIKDQIAAQQIATLRKNCEAVGIPLFDIGSGRQGIVHVIGPELGLDPAGQDDRLWRQPHQHARRIWSAGIWHRDVRSGARAGDAVRLANEAAQHADFGLRETARGHDLQGLDSRDHPPAGHRRRHGPCDRVCGRGGSQPHYGRAHDDVQHEHRMWGTCRHGRP